MNDKLRRPDLDLDVIKQRLERATSGPWVSYIEGREQMSGSSFIMTAGDDIYLSGATDADQDFIAGCRQDVPALIEEIEYLRSILSTVKIN